MPDLLTHRLAPRAVLYRVCNRRIGCEEHLGSGQIKIALPFQSYKLVLRCLTLFVPSENQTQFYVIAREQTCLQHTRNLLPPPSSASKLSHSSLYFSPEVASLFSFSWFHFHVYFIAIALFPLFAVRS